MQRLTYSLAAVASLVCTTFVTSRARADATNADATPPAVTTRATPEPRTAPVQLHLDGAAGVSTSGVMLGTLGLVRVGFLEVGGSFGTSGLFSTRTGGGVALGAGAHRPGGGGFDVLLEVGVNQHHVMGGGGLLSSDTGATGSIPYGGLRAGIDWSFGSRSAIIHGTLGLWLVGRVDLETRGASYQYQDTGLFSGRSDTRDGHVQLGGGGELGLALAGGFDLLP